MGFFIEGQSVSINVIATKRICNILPKALFLLQPWEHLLFSVARNINILANMKFSIHSLFLLALAMAFDAASAAPGKYDAAKKFSKPKNYKSKLECKIGYSVCVRLINPILAPNIIPQMASISTNVYLPFYLYSTMKTIARLYWLLALRKVVLEPTLTRDERDAGETLSLRLK